MRPSSSPTPAPLLSCSFCSRHPASCGEVTHTPASEQYACCPLSLECFSMWPAPQSIQGSVQREISFPPLPKQQPLQQVLLPLLPYCVAIISFIRPSGCTLLGPGRLALVWPTSADPVPPGFHSAESRQDSVGGGKESEVSFHRSRVGSFPAGLCVLAGLLDLRPGLLQKPLPWASPQVLAVPPLPCSQPACYINPCASPGPCLHLWKQSLH